MTSYMIENSPPSSPSKAMALREQILDLVAEYANLKYSYTPFVPGQTPIPPSGKLLGSDELCSLVDASLDGWLTTGRFNKCFEELLASFIGVKHVLTVNSGSSANLIAFSALTSPLLGELRIKPGDEVISVAAGFPTTVNPILQNNCIPVFVDVDISTLNIDITQLSSALSPRTRAIFLAHTLGNPFNLAAIRSFCDQHNLWLIEDCCDALGSTFDSKHVGTFGDIATLSFYPAHHITMGEGGAVFTNNAKLKRIAESFRDWGRDCFCPPGQDNTCGKRYSFDLGQLPTGYDHKYIYSHVGYNLKITDMQAACGLAQLKHLDEFIAARKFNYNYLLTSLSKYKKFFGFVEQQVNCSNSWFGFPLTILPDAPFERSSLIHFLNDHQVGTRLLFAGNITKQPLMVNQEYKVTQPLVNTDYIMKHTFWIGVQPSLSADHLSYVGSNNFTFYR